MTGLLKGTVSFETAPPFYNLGQRTAAVKAAWKSPQLLQLHLRQ
jgi:hypothetical protein